MRVKKISKFVTMVRQYKYYVFGHYPHTVLFIFQNTTFRRPDSASVGVALVFLFVVVWFPPSLPFHTCCRSHRRSFLPPAVVVPAVILPRYWTTLQWNWFGWAPMEWVWGTVGHSTLLRVNTGPTSSTHLITSLLVIH
jgi:hypothetical protein